ncbi:hypothetical protein C8J57DRAFT_1332048 [Mycena rebaudengoi]|nr:hypothetical protein C8J57DRAFT_1332048 [Mycena rebaudengoi]
MSNFLVRKLDPSTARVASDPGSVPELSDIEAVLAKAFKTDVFVAIVTGHDPNGTDTGYVGPFCITTVVCGLLGGEVYVAETNDAARKIVGCAVWFGPGRSMYDSADQQQQVLGPLMATFDEKLQSWWQTEFLPRYDSFVSAALGEGTKHNSWHLQTLGVDPEYQRKGAAALLINTMIAKAAHSRDKLCLETGTDVNLEIYSRLGFEIMPKGKGGKEDCVETFTGVDGNTFPMWAMARNST